MINVFDGFFSVLYFCRIYSGIIIIIVIMIIKLMADCQKWEQKSVLEIYVLLIIMAMDGQENYVNESCVVCPIIIIIIK